MLHRKSTMALAAALSAGVLVSGAAHALPSNATMPVVNSSSQIEHVDYRGYGRGYGHRGGRGYGRGVGIGIGAAILGGALIAGAARSERYGYYGDDVDGPVGYGGNGLARCANAFKSFDASSGTYMGYDGERHTCPYL